MISDMKDIRFNISLYVIIPIIFAGMTVLATLLAYRLTLYYIQEGGRPGWPVAFWGTLLAFFALISGLLIVKFLIDPVKRFVDQTQTMGVVSSLDPETENQANKDDDMLRFSRVFDQVTELLSKVEARELFPEIIGQSKAMRGVFNQIMKVAPTDSTVLILGETGTGKELVARSIHKHSRRNDKPFVAINCAAIPEGLLESELFGYEKGAFTGASQRKIGKLELANNGTVFLDEIGDMPLNVQAKVLRALEEQEIERIGAMNPVKVNLRLIAATNKDLSKMVDQGIFRRDLYYRLNVFTIYLPPLRERREDIALLAEKFIEKSSPGTRISSSAFQIMMAYDWPGNVRELENSIESACLMAGSEIKPHHLPAAVASSIWPNVNNKPSASENLISDRRVVPDLGTDQNLDEQLRQIEISMIVDALSKTGGVQIRAAKLLGIKERSLWHRLKKYEIDVSAFKSKPPPTKT